MSSPLKIAIVGSGITGLGAAHRLHQRLGARAVITLFEAQARLGGHTHTVDVTLDGITHGVDTGFLVYNERTYPELIALFAQLGVATAKSDMSFSVKLPALDLEWSGASLNTVFAQRRNVLRPRFLLMLREVLRFNKAATALALAGSVAQTETIGEFLTRERFSNDFRAWYFMPMIACIWSCPTAQMLEFPIATMLRFCHNHGLLQVANRPQWWTVKGGARHYIDAIVRAINLTDIRLNAAVTRVERTPDNQVSVATVTSSERFDHVILASHPDQSLAALSAPTAAERAVLGAIRYQANEAVLHTDASVLPKRRLAWAAWNYESHSNGAAAQSSAVCLHYLLNQLQPLPFSTPVVVSLNPLRQPAANTVIKRIAYDHPVFDQGAIAAQQQLHSIQGIGGVWFGGAWAGYGFHEDGLKAGLAVAEHIAKLA